VDVVHGTNHIVPPSRRARLVSVYDTWFLTHPEGVHPDVARMADVLRRSVRDGAVVHTSSHASAARLRELLAVRGHEPRVEVIHLGTPPPPAPRDPDEPPDLPTELTGHPWVLALGTREKRKNLPTLVRAYGAAISTLGTGERHGSRLVIAGAPGNDDPAIDAAIEALPTDVRHQVLMLGTVSDSRKQALLEGARVLAYPSLDEGFGLPILEAMAAGTPVVASTAGSIPEVAGDAALLVAHDDVDGLAAALVRVLDDDELCRTLEQAGRRRAEQFTWADTARAMTDLYSSLAMETHRS
jgi:glycosyltransferase involved in cell wall biosynthesis